MRPMKLPGPGASTRIRPDFRSLSKLKLCGAVAVLGGAYTLSSRLIVQIFTWSVTIVAARILRPYDYGVLTAAATVTNLADLIAEAGVCKALVQKPDVSENDFAEAFTFCLVLSMAIYLSLFACAGLAARALPNSQLVAVLRTAGLVLLLVPFTVVPTAILERRLQLNRLITIGLSFSIIQGFLVLIFVLAGWGYWSLIIGYMASEVPERAGAGVADILASEDSLAGSTVESSCFVWIALHRGAALLVLVPKCRLCRRRTFDGTHRIGLLFDCVYADFVAG